MTATAFALIGDRFHNSDYIRTGLSKVLVEGLDMAVDFTDDLHALSADNLARYDLLIVFRDGMVWPDGYGRGAPYPGYDPNTHGTLSDPPTPELEQKAVQCKDILSNLHAVNLQDKATIHQATVSRALNTLNTPYDLVLMDPPYTQPFPLDVLRKLQERMLIHKTSLIIVGHASRVASPENCGEFVRWQDRRYGDSSIAFYLSSGRESTK